MLVKPPNFEASELHVTSDVTFRVTGRTSSYSAPVGLENICQRLSNALSLRRELDELGAALCGVLPTRQQIVPGLPVSVHLPERHDSRLTLGCAKPVRFIRSAIGTGSSDIATSKKTGAICICISGSSLRNSLSISMMVRNSGLSFIDLLYPVSLT